MNNENSNSGNVLSALGGLLIGGLAGAVTMYLMAPQSGKRTRMQIRQRSIQLRDQTTEMIEDAVAQVSSEGRKLGKEGRHKAKELLHKGQALITGQLEHVTDAVKTGKKTIQNARISS